MYNSTYNSADNYKFDTSGVQSKQKQEEEKRKLRRIYSTELIDELIRERGQGYDIPYDAFFQRDLELRAPGVTFRMTPEEIETYQKCYDNAVYYVRNFCKFMTDNGRQTVELRDFQEKIIKIVTDEQYLPEIDDFGPENRNVIWMAARQSGKCYTYLTEVETPEGRRPVGEIYSSKSKDNTSLTKRKIELYKLYSKAQSRLAKNLIGKSIELLETYEFRGLDLDENDISKKIISTKSLTDINVLADIHYVPATEVHMTQPYQVYEIVLDNGNSIECADNHIIYNEHMQEIFAVSVKAGDTVLTKTGPSKVKSVYKCPYKLAMYDMTVDSPEHRYYTNNILSHNTTTIAAFLSWMLVFHADRNILVVANKEKTAIEIVDKITNVFRGLPYFMKPGCVNFGKMGLKLENGSQLMCSATTKSASIGFTIHCILLDEFAHIPENIVNNFWRSVYPTLSSSKVSQCIITSTPNGTTNKFYEIWSKSIEKKNSFVNLRTDYYEVPGHDDKWAAQMKADFGEEEFAQEFQLQFNVNSRLLAKAEDLMFMNYICKDYVHKAICGGNAYLNDENLTWHPDFDPNEIEETDKFVFLVDLAEGGNEDDKMFKSKKKEPDFNTISIYKVVANSIANMKRYSGKSCQIQDAFRFIQVGKYSCNTEDEVYCAKVCAALAYDLMKDDERDSVRVMVEMNFNGKSYTNEFKRHPNYADSTIQRTYHTKPIPGEKQRRHLGFKTTSNKEYYCIKGNKMINLKRIVVTDKKTYEQIQSFGYVKGKLMGIACHDDLSMPTFNHIPRMLDDDTFKSWLEEILYEYPDETKKYNINLLLEKWDMDNPETSDSDFNSMYNIPDTYEMFQSSPYSENNMTQTIFNAPTTYSNIGSIGSYNMH